MNKEFLRNFWYSLSPNQRFLIRRIYYLPIDCLDKLRGRNHKYVPPRGSIYTGSAGSAINFLKQSHHQLNLLKNEIDLKPNDSILDIGSGIGRTAISLSTYLNKEGRYDGFDVVKKGVDWCKKTIGKDFSNFHFKYIPLFNDLYNTSTSKADNFIFPYQDKSFDKVFSFSVFTHMQINEIQNYFKEINRVLKPNGIAFSTFFLYDDNSEAHISTSNTFKFTIKKDNYRLMNDKVKSGNIAIHKDKLNQMLSQENLSIVKIIDGFWKDPSKYFETAEYQDILVFKKH